MLVGGAILGAGIWIASPIFTGHVEPWDSEGPFYLPVMVVGSFIVGLLFSPGSNVRSVGNELLIGVLGCFFGVWIGQLLAIMIIPTIEKVWFLLFLLTTGIGSLLALPGALAGAFLRQYYDYRRR